nr:PREDICTED: uncharacterized protein LOC102353636 [Latimeria chalumnae]|eukprot:XP_014343728.1 PREDICTED: uncharacterized protein LOC102353636 [Latimeria chalumnae]
MASWENGRKTAATDLCFDILEANSPANQYLVQLLESKKEISIQEPTESRMKFLFQLLDNLLPKLGVFSRVVKLIRDELYEAVYSFQITADPQPKSETADMVTRVPYFSLFRRIQDERNEEAEKLQSELDCIRELFSERDNELLQLKLTVSEMQNCSETFISTITNLKNELEKKNEEITRINENYQFQEKEKAEQARLYESTITKLQSLLQVTQDQVTSLKQYKKIYDGLQEAFQYPIGKKKKNAILAISSKSPTNRRAIVATKKAHLYSYLEATKHLKYQLLQVQNAVIEDFDVFMEKHRQQLLSKKLQESVEVPDKKEECKEKQRTFQQSIMDISVELNLLNKHSESLQQQLKELETIQHKEQQVEEKAKSAEHTAQASGSRVTSGSSGLGRGSSILSDLTDTLDDSVKNFFFSSRDPDEIVLNKYAAVIYTSCNNGQIYEEVKGVTACRSCGEKTLICPHKISNNSVIELPKNCTHIKISRPRAHIIMMEAKLLQQETQMPIPVCGEGSVISSESSSIACVTKEAILNMVSAEPSNKFRDTTIQPSLAPGACKTQLLQADSSWQWEEKNALNYNFSSIWDHFIMISQLRRELPRTISLVNGLYS